MEGRGVLAFDHDKFHARAVSWTGSLADDDAGAAFHFAQVVFASSKHNWRLQRVCESVQNISPARGLHCRRGARNSGAPDAGIDHRPLTARSTPTTFPV